MALTISQDAGEPAGAEGLDDERAAVGRGVAGELDLLHEGGAVASDDRPAVPGEQVDPEHRGEELVPDSELQGL